MLYVTTRDGGNPVPAEWVLTHDRAPEGGLYTPASLPSYTGDDLADLKNKSENQIIAEILNLFFERGLTEWDVRLCLGQNPGKVCSMPHRIHFLEMWNNPGWSVKYAVRSLGQRMGLSKGDAAGKWVTIALYSALLFGAYAELLRQGVLECGDKLDVAVSVGDFSAPMAALYAGAMGLPVGGILCGCNENGALWDLLKHGQVRTGVQPLKTDTPLCDWVIPPWLEDGIFRTLGQEETLRFVRCCEKSEIYLLNEENREIIAGGVHAAVVGSRRMTDLMNTLYATGRYRMGPYTALAYAAVQDYRSTGAAGCDALVLGERCAEEDGLLVSRAIGVPPEELRIPAVWN
ncbi:MAG: hypothetical protein PUF71_05140 [Firmicutes bacterium]|nr:hypothetical protein [Bacillota bacterium]